MGSDLGVGQFVEICSLVVEVFRVYVCNWQFFLLLGFFRRRWFRGRLFAEVANSVCLSWRWSSSLALVHVRCLPELVIVKGSHVVRFRKIWESIVVALIIESGGIQRRLFLVKQFARRSWGRPGTFLFFLSHRWLRIVWELVTSWCLNRLVLENLI